MKPTHEYFVRLSDLRKPISENPFDPNKGTISGYLRYLKYNTPEADIVGVTRCKDCAYGIDYRYNDKHMVVCSFKCNGLQSREDFCSRGVPKGDKRE